MSNILDTISAKDPRWGVRGDGSNETEALRSLFASGAKQIIFPPGNYAFSGTLNIPAWVHLVGQTYQPGVGGDGRAVTLQCNMISGNAINCSEGVYIENIIIISSAGSYDEATQVLNGATSTALQIMGSVMLRNVQFVCWHKCINLGLGPNYRADYVKTYGVEFNRCTYGYYSENATPFNLHIDSPISRMTRYFMSGASEYPIDNVKVFGGSVEGYYRIAQYVNHVAFFGTYFETKNPITNAFAFDYLSKDGSLSLYGCIVYLNGCARFVNASGLENYSLIGIGNTFRGYSATAANCYIYYLPNSGSVHLKADQVSNNLQNTIRYTNSTNSALQCDITYPLLPAGNIQFVLSKKTLINSGGLITLPLSSEPAKSTRISGQMVLADGVNWDPLGHNYRRPYWVIWQGDRWSAISG